MATMRLDSGMTPSPTVAYDANGNVLSDASGKDYTWDFENRLTQAVVPGQNGGTTTFKYDPFGRRIQKVGPLGTTNYLYDGPNLLEEIDNVGNVLARYTQNMEIDEPLAELRSGTISYYQQDGLGSSTSLSNSSGALANTYTYDSYGKLTASSGGISNPFQYTGRELDIETGIYYYRARYYDQNMGRFVSEDPLKTSGGLNFYRYARNSPIAFADPSGDVVINPGKFPSGSVADVVIAIQRIQDSIRNNPGCDCYFKSHGSKSLSDLIDDPNIWINFNPNRTWTPGGWAHGETFPGSDPNDMWLFPDATTAGIDDIAWTIVHELYHINNPGGTEDEAETAASKCAPMTTININVTPKP
jgi:RHS repeat-associated protein